MKRRYHQQIVIFVVLLLTFGLTIPCFGQALDTSTLGNDPEKYVAFAQSIYWQALSQDEKQTFLFAYIASAYEVRKMANDMIYVESRKAHKFNEKIDWLFRVWQDLLEMEDNADGSIDEFIGWIDLYYQIDFNRTLPFYEALAYAHQKVTAGDRALLDLFWGKYPAPEGELDSNALEQLKIERRIATAEAHKSLDAAGELGGTSIIEESGSTTQIILTESEERLVELAVETECLNKNDPEKLNDVEFIEALAREHGFESMAEFNVLFGNAQDGSPRWEYMNKLIIEKAFDKNCM